MFLEIDSSSLAARRRHIEGNGDGNGDNDSG
jgi:hypothetical protein